MSDPQEVEDLRSQNVLDHPTPRDTDQVQYLTSGWFEQGVHRSIVGSILLTFATVTAYIPLQSTPAVKWLEQALRRSGPPESSASSGNKLLEQIRGLTGNIREEKVRSFIAGTSPNLIIGVVVFLSSKETSPEAKQLAVTIAERSGRRYKDKRLLFIAADKMISGHLAKQDFNAAKNILELPEMLSDSRTAYYLGLLWSNKANPAINLPLAKSYLEQAVKAGYAPAANALASF
jgi:hypothetical protein